MSGDTRKLQPIIVKKIKKGGHAAHGGAWKIAYADFVTAMMAFFLLMWLLGSTTEGDKKGLADFFNTPLKISMGGGSGSGDSSSLIRGGGEDFSRTNGQVKRGDIEAQRRTMNLQALKQEQRRGEAQRLAQLQQEIAEQIKQHPAMAEFADQIRIDMTRDGLRIQITDEQNRPLFDSGSAVLKPWLRAVMHAITDVLLDVPNRLTVEGHTDAKPFDQMGYGNWELSSDRANAARREMVASGLPADRVLRVLGLASSQPLKPEDPLDPQNRRISIIVMNQDAVQQAMPAPPPAELAPFAGLEPVRADEPRAGAPAAARAQPAASAAAAPKASASAPRRAAAEAPTAGGESAADVAAREAARAVQARAAQAFVPPPPPKPFTGAEDR